MNGAVGDDELGLSLKLGLEEKGTDVTGLLALSGQKMGQVVVTAEQKTRQSSSLGFKGANRLFQPRNNGVECLAGDTRSKPDILITHCTLRLETVEQLLETAYKTGVETVLSTSPAVSLDSGTYAHVDHLVFNEHESAEMSDHVPAEFEDLEVAKETAALFIGYGVKYTVITLGDAGVVYATFDGKRG